MKIYGENTNIIFECDYCHERLELPQQKSKTGFMRKLNPFVRTHDHTCKWNHERKVKVDDAKEKADEIIRKLTVATVD